MAMSSDANREKAVVDQGLALLMLLRFHGRLRGDAIVLTSGSNAPILEQTRAGIVTNEQSSESIERLFRNEGVCNWKRRSEFRYWNFAP